MHSTSAEIERFPDGLARKSSPGDRLVPIRDLMRRFGASQPVVQRALQSLKARGLIAAEVGRGTYFRGEAGMGSDTVPTVASRKVRSVLLLRRSISIARGRALMDGLQGRFTEGTACSRCHTPTRTMPARS